MPGYDIDEVLADQEEVSGLQEKECKLEVVAPLVKKMRDLEADVAKREKELKEKQDELRKVQEEEIPNYLGQFGITSLGLDDGSYLVVNDDIRIGVTKEHLAEAMAWLRGNNHDGIIKNECVVPFGKGQDDSANEFKKLMEEKGFSYENKEYVHWQTLKAWAVREMKKGTQIPTETFSLFPFKVAKVKPAKGR